MSSNPLMMGYEGGDLLLTGAAWPTVRSLPRPVCAGCRRWPVWSGGSGQWRERIRGGTAGLTAGRRPSAFTTMRYTNRRSFYLLFGECFNKYVFCMTFSGAAWHLVQWTTSMSLQSGRSTWTSRHATLVTDNNQGCVVRPPCHWFVCTTDVTRNLCLGL